MDNPWIAYRAQEHCQQFMQEARQERLASATNPLGRLARWARAWQAPLKAIHESIAVKRDSQPHPWGKVRPAIR